MKKLDVVLSGTAAMMMLDEIFIGVCRIRLAKECREVNWIRGAANQEAATGPVVRHQIFLYKHVTEFVALHDSSDFSCDRLASYDKFLLNHCYARACLFDSCR